MTLSGRQREKSEIENKHLLVQRSPGLRFILGNVPILQHERIHVLPQKKKKKQIPLDFFADDIVVTEISWLLIKGPLFFWLALRMPEL